MGIQQCQGKILAGHTKYRQINKYIEIIDNLLEQQHPLRKDPQIVDMGAGYGYLTFAAVRPPY